MTDVFSIEGVEAVFAADLAEFVATRDALVKELKAAGDKDGAAAVKQLKKPSTVAWGVNRVVRENPDDVAALVEAAAAVRAAQVRAVQGNDAGGLREASREWRRLVNELAGKVGRLVGAQYRDEAAATFEAASAEEGLTDVLRAGRFTAAVAAAGFGLAGMPDPGPAPERRTRAEPRVADAPTAEVDEVDGVDEAAEAAKAEAHEALVTAEKKLETALHRLRRAEQRLDQARAAVDEARLAHQDATAVRDAAAASLQALDG